MSLQVRLISAQLSHDTQLFSNMDPYCILQLGNQRYRSKTQREAGKKPAWNENFQFNSADNVLKVTVMDQDTITDDLVGEGTINISKYRSVTAQQQEIIQLYYNGKTAGKVNLMIRSGASQNAWGNGNANSWGNTNNWSQSNNQQFGQPSMNQQFGQQFTQPYSQPSMNQQFNQPYSQPNQWNQPPPPQWGSNNQNSWGVQGNMPMQANTPWGDLSQNNGWGNFNPSSPNGQQNMPMSPPVNPLQALGTILKGPSNQNGYGYNQPPSNYGGNQYSNNPYR